MGGREFVPKEKSLPIGRGLSPWRPGRTRTYGILTEDGELAYKNEGDVALGDQICIQS
jgi:hypothetical protein